MEMAHKSRRGTASRWRLISGGGDGHGFSHRYRVQTMHVGSERGVAGGGAKGLRREENDETNVATPAISESVASPVPVFTWERGSSPPDCSLPYIADARHTA